MTDQDSGGITPVDPRPIVPAIRPTIATMAAEVERICDEIDATTQELPHELIQRFEASSLALGEKVDRWIAFLEGAKAREALLKARLDDARIGLRVVENLQTKAKAYLKSQIELTPDVPFKGSLGRIALQKNPPRVDVRLVTSDRQVYDVIDATALQLEPSVNKYVKQITFYVLDKETLKADLLAGAELTWARIEQGQHVRIRQ